MEDQNLAAIILDAERLGLTFMGDEMIGFKFVGGTRETRRIQNLVLEKFIPEGFAFNEEFFECFGIFPAPFETEKWNEEYGRF